MKILTLTSKLPWPLTDGAVIRDFNLLREAARHHEIYLLSFLFKPEDREHFSALQPYCQRIVGVDLHRPLVRTVLNAGLGVVGRTPFIIREYWDRAMAATLQRVVQEEQIDVIHSHFLHMSQYVAAKGRAAFVHDAHNLEHVLWKRLSRTLTNPAKRLFAASQYEKFVRLQSHVGRVSQRCVTLSDEDRREYLRICPEAQIATVPNGADVEYYEPRDVVPERNSILYFGNLSWPPQADAAKYFHDTILPQVVAAVPDTKFYIVGQNPPDSLKQLASDRVIVTGFVEDMRDYIARAAVVIMPLRVGAGTKHRVFQALAMKKAMVCTSVAAEGIALSDGQTALLADDPREFGAATIRLLEDAELRRALGERGRQLVLDQYDWRSIGKRLDQVFHEAVGQRREAN